MSELGSLSKVGIVIAFCNAFHNICRLAYFGIQSGFGFAFDFSIYKNMDAKEWSMLGLLLSVVIMSLLLICAIKKRCRVFLGFWIAYSVVEFVALYSLRWSFHTVDTTMVSIVVTLMDSAIQIMIIYPIYILLKEPPSANTTHRQLF